MKSVCNFLSGVILLFLCGLAVILFVPKAFGYQNFVVISGSMEPKIPIGSIVYTKPVEFRDLAPHDVISFSIGEQKVTHRIVLVNEEKQQVITKGDANNVVDAEPVSASSIIGKECFTIPYLGYLSIWIRTPLGIAIGCGMIFLILLLNLLPELHKKKESV